MANSSGFIWQVATVALIVYVTRWLLSAKGAQLPKTRGDTCVYGIKWQMRLVGLGCSAVFAATIVGFRHDFVEGGDRWLLIIPVAFILAGIAIASSSVTTDRSGITKKVLGFSRSVRWDEITEIQFYEKQGYIRLRAGSRKLTIDSVFVAISHLLNEIVDRTKAQPTIRYL